MKITELIKKLQEVADKNPDIEIVKCHFNRNDEERFLPVYNAKTGIVERDTFQDGPNDDRLIETALDKATHLLID
jgi:hypothetical protein